MNSILFDHADFLVAIKPSGLAFGDDDDQMGFFHQIEITYGSKLYAVHRLDKVTSGLMLMAKSSEAASILGQMLMQHTLTKVYLAIAGNHPKKKQGLISGDMQKSRRGTYKLLSSKQNPAITEFKSFSLKEGLRYYVLRPLTGKTHQLRVMMKSLGTPILGDVSYGGTAFDRTYLHAYALSFKYKGEDFEFRNIPNEGEYFACSTILDFYQQQIALTDLFPKLLNKTIE
jgi:tRNA pseudouridine32 synthase / 23S rRNA pseudouridine746 synthase